MQKKKTMTMCMTVSNKVFVKEGEDLGAKKRHKFVPALKSHPPDFYNEQKTQLEATLVILTHDNDNVNNFSRNKTDFANFNITYQKSREPLGPDF